MIFTTRRKTPGNLSAHRGVKSRRQIQKAADGSVLDMLEERRLLSAPHHFHTWHHLHSIAPFATVGVTIDSKVKGTAKGTGVRKGGVVPTFSGSSVPSGFTPTQVKHAYGVDQLSFGSVAADGSGQTIVIVDAYDDPTITNDLQQFDKAFGLPDPPSFQVIYGSGSKPATDGAQGAGQLSWEVEESLDVEWAHAMAPEANIILDEAASDNYDDLIGPNTNESPTAYFGGVYTATHTAGADVVSMSWGGSEFGGAYPEVDYDPYFTSLAGHSGITYFASTGDSGNPGGYPSWSPDVVAVGGTKLTLSNGNYGSETTWNDSSGSTGGGISRFEAQPSYQKGVVTQSSTKRTTPDVAMLADPATGVPVYDSWDFGSSTPWIQLGGTSLASPLWAGLMSIVDQDRGLNGQTPLDGPTQTLPALYKLPSGDFHDITTGSNNTYSATTGYDLVTGLGTPIAQNLVPDLANVGSSPSISLSSGNNSVVLAKDADGLHADVSLNGTQVQQFVPADATSLNFTGGSGNDTFTLNFSKGNPIPTGNSTQSGNGTTVPGLTINGNGGINALDIIGTSGNDSVTASSLGVSLGGGIATPTAPSISNIQTISLAGGSGGNDSLNISGGSWNIDANTPSGTPNVTVNVSGGSLATFIGNENLAGLHVNGSTVALPTLASYTINLQGPLTLINNGTFDLQKGELLLDTADTSYTTLESYLATGYNNGNWNGTGGIKSSAAATNSSKNTGLGYANGADGVVAGLASGEAEVKYTVIGDADLSGSVDVSDLNIALNHYLSQSTTTWDSGDFTFDGHTDLNDLNSIMNNYLMTVS